MSGLEIDTRSDIHNLGVLLYELLAGSTPFDAKELMSQGIDAMRKTIREKDRPGRSETANGIASDFKRDLNHEPVVARAPAAAWQHETRKLNPREQREWEPFNPADG